MHTPWGPSQTIERLTDGALNVSTASHGGLMLNATEAATLPANIRAAAERSGEWFCYEEDCAFGLVMEFRPDLYRTHRRLQIESWRQTLSHPFPPEWATKDGPGAMARMEAELQLSDAEIIQPFIRSNREWFPELFGLGPRCWECWQLNCPGHTHQLIAVAAWGDWCDGSTEGRQPVPAGMVGVCACYGGRNRNGQYASELQYFLVPAADYAEKGRIFVVDPARHPKWEKREQAA